jgi:hypothetical protein
MYLKRNKTKQKNFIDFLFLSFFSFCFSFRSIPTQLFYSIRICAYNFLGKCNNIALSRLSRFSLSALLLSVRYFVDAMRYAICDEMRWEGR